jgi:hypothetical protein
MLPAKYIVVLLIAATSLSIIASLWRRKRKLRKYIREQFGKEPVGRNTDKLESVRKYWQTCAARFPEYRAIDETTWYDLEMDLFFEAINTTWSSVGSEVLYARLHRLTSSDLEQLIQVFLEKEDLRTEVAYCLHDIGKADYHYAEEFLFDPESQKPVGYRPWQSYLPLAGLAVAPYHLLFGLLIVSIGIAWNIRTRMTYRAQTEYGIEAVRYISGAITRGKKILSLLSKASPDDAVKLRDAIAPLKAIVSIVPLQLGAGDPLSVVLEYFNYTLLLDFNMYNRILSHLIKNPGALHHFWETLWNVEIALVIASMEQRYSMVKPVFHAEHSIIAKDIVHPLVKNAVPNSVDFSMSTLVSGSNASGKSTYVKAIAISAITSQNLHRAFAGSFAMKRGQIITSMAIRDNIYKGDSYFVAEIKSLKRMIEACREGNVVYLFIDEILKGTNTVERIAASHSLLEWFEKKGGLVISATHDIELTELLSGIMKNIHFRETVTDDEILFDYKLKDGPTRTTNAINLLHYYDFPDEIVEPARMRAERFLRKRSWREEDN